MYSRNYTWKKVDSYYKNEQDVMYYHDGFKDIDREGFK